MALEVSAHSHCGTAVRQNAMTGSMWVKQAASFTVIRKQRWKKGLRAKYTLQALLTFFLQLGPVSYDAHHRPVTH